jgi:DNA (cytosine-5)-methyltransferase 1
MLRVISEIRPTWVVAENVTGIISLALDQTISDLESEGYETITFNIPACAVEAQHERQRIWIVAHTESQQDRWRIQPTVRTNTGTVRETRTLANTNIEGSQRHWQPRECARELPIRASRSKQDAIPNRNTEPNMGMLASRLPIELVRPRPIGDEPDIPRLTTGDTNRVNKLRSLGNAIVPQVAYEILEKIAIIEQQTIQLSNNL